MAYEKLEYSNSAELCERMAAECDTCILAFSTGKDSIAAWLQLRKYFKRIIPYYCYLVPGLEFVEESLKYYEDFFKTHIWRLPHRALFRFLRNGLFQPPQRIIAIENMYIPTREVYNDITVGNMIRNSARLPEAAYIATGVRSADSPMRLVSIRSHGAISHKSKQFYPVYDWKKRDLLQAFDESGVQLPVDYHIWGRTFDGLDYRFMKPMKEYFPHDYEKIMSWFPLLEMETFRREMEG